MLSVRAAPKIRLPFIPPAGWERAAAMNHPLSGLSPHRRLRITHRERTSPQTMRGPDGHCGPESSAHGGGAPAGLGPVGVLARGRQCPG